jgi:hypothetical protein
VLQEGKARRRVRRPVAGIAQGKRRGTAAQQRDDCGQSGRHEAPARGAYLFLADIAKTVVTVWN